MLHFPPKSLNVAGKERLCLEVPAVEKKKEGKGLLSEGEFKKMKKLRFQVY